MVFTIKCDVTLRIPMRGYEPSSSSDFLDLSALRIPMRGYENYEVASNGVQSACYESPCGVMRFHLHLQFYLALKLRIPMRGYENNNIQLIKPYSLCYESPCGVMSSRIRCQPNAHAGLRIPMRGYERVELLEGKFGGLVTNPHAGL